MPPRQAVAAAAGAGQQQEDEGGFKKIFNIVTRGFMIYMVSQMVFGQSGLVAKWMGTSKSSNQAVPSSSQVPGSSTASSGNDANAAQLGGPQTATCMYAPGSLLDLWVFLNTEENVEHSTFPFEKYSTSSADVVSNGKGGVTASATSKGLPWARFEGIQWGDWQQGAEIDVTLKVTDEIANGNTSVWADVFVTPSQMSPAAGQSGADVEVVGHSRKLLTKFLPRKKIRAEKNLFNKEKANEEPDEEIDYSAGYPHWHNNLTLAVVSDTSAILPIGKLPPPIRRFVQLEKNEKRDPTGEHVYHYPVVFPNDFWQLRGDMYPVNDTLKELPLHVSFAPISFFKFQIFASMNDAFDKQAAGNGGASAGMAGSEMDMLKDMLANTNPWFLGLTIVVSILHSLFEFLAFSSDVSHWRKKEDLVGVSVWTIVTNVFVQLIILLYLLDNNDNTSWMILAGQGIGLLIEAWKITKAVTIRVIPTPAGSRLPYWVEIKDKHVLSEEEKKTQEYDRLAFKYVSWVAVPLLGAYSIYSALYKTHRGWYSFVISTLTSYVYAFGFVSLIPQLIVNYKLKSVAHINTKAMVYKILGTFVDDLFAFCIKMPTLHRLACFRDDIVFFIFLYQRWIYRIDKTRVNEFGQVSEPVEKEKKAIEGEGEGEKGEEKEESKKDK